MNTHSYGSDRWGTRAGIRPVAAFIAAAGLPAPLCAVKPAPVYSPDFWNARERVRLINCYGYALQIPDWVHIGDLAVRAPADTVSHHFNRAVADGLHPARWNDPVPVPGYYLVALVSGKGWHWYRQDADGTWSHKDGEDAVTNLDASGQVITDPRRADRGVYDSFDGFFYAPIDGPKRAGWHP